jgi:Na+/H+ antiporter NhaD/arsenite permease-like protein
MSRFVGARWVVPLVCALAVAAVIVAAALPGPLVLPPFPAPELRGFPVEFILFGFTLLGVAVFHQKTLAVAVTGLTAIAVYKILFAGFETGTGTAGLLAHLGHEWVVIANLFCLLTGFSLLANHFEESRLPMVLPRFLPHDWRGAFLLLVAVFVLSSFLDNIAAALIGGAVAHTVFSGRVHIGYIAAIVAASNAGGSGSVVGDTTTTMMWIGGISPAAVFHAYVAAAAAVAVCGIVASHQQHVHSPIRAAPPADTHVDWARMAIVGVILGAVILVNVAVSLRYPAQAEAFPYIGLAVWAAIVLTAPWRRPSWSLLPGAARGACFLLSLVLAATMMPVEKLPAASWQTTFGLGFLSSVFDNIPLTALAIRQGGYDWGVLAYAVGFGGSMLWFGSSAGVAISSMYTEARSVGAWLKSAWHVALGYVAGFFLLMAVLGWQPSAESHCGAAHCGTDTAPAQPRTVPHGNLSRESFPSH